MIERIDTFVRDLLAADGTPAIAIALTDRERTIHVAAHGMANIEAGLPATPEHLFEIGSISKSFAAVVVLQLADEGLLDLHAPVTEYIPWFDVRSDFEPITLHHLLTHTAGLVSGSLGFLDGRAEVWALRRTQASTPPGAYFHYSNVGYEAIGLAVSAVTGMPFHEALRRRVLEPLGMRATTPDFTNLVRPRLAVGYLPAADDRPYVAGRSPLAPATWFVGDTADGAICSTPGDMAAYLRMWLNRGLGPDGPLLTEEAFATMTTPSAATVDSPDGGYGYGVGVTTRDGRSVIEHSGGMVGYVAQAIADVDAGVGVIVLASGPARVRDIARYAIEAMAAAGSGAEIPPARIIDLRVVEDASDHAGEYVGPDGTVTLESEGTSLIMVHEGRRLALTRTGAGAMTFVADHPDFADAPIELVRPTTVGGDATDGENDDAAVTELFIGRHWYAGERYEGPREFAYPEAWDAYAGLYRAHNPWQTAWRFVVRKGTPWLVDPGSGTGFPLEPAGDATFRFAEDERLPERARFHSFADGVPLCMELEGLDYYRFADPVSAWNDRAE